MTARIAALNVYPVKGCRGIAVDTASVAVTGLVTDGVGDREWMVVDRDGRFITQRDLPRLALVRTATDGEALHLSAAGGRPLAIPLSQVSGAARDIVVWRSNVRGLDAGDAAAAWLSAWLAADVRLVRFERSQPRACNPEYAGDSGAHTMFADGYPLLVVGTESLNELNARLAQRGQDALPMNRFRPNVVIEGLPPFAEDHVDTFTSGDVVLKLVKPCVRCQVTTTDQQTAEVGIEPLRTLGEFRMDQRFDGVTFGMNAIIKAGAGRMLKVGAPIAAEYNF